VDNIKKQIYQPGICANPSDRWLAEVRDGGWLIDRAFFDTEPEAQTWLDNHTGEKMSKGVANEYLHMFHRWANK